MHFQASRAGFSLIELIVSIAVIAILAALTMNVLDSMKARNGLLHSASNVRSIGAATLVFAQEHSGELPVWHDYSRGMYWWQQLRPYCGGDDRVFGSPAHEEFDKTDDLSVARTISYGWNYEVMGRHKGDPDYEKDQVNSQNAFIDIPRVLVLTDGPKADSWGYINYYDHFADENRYGNNMTVALFLDGHVEAMPVVTFRNKVPYFVSLEAGN